MRHLISTFAAQVQIPGRWCFATASWGDWTSNTGSVLGLYPPWGIRAAQTLVGRGPAGLGCTVILLYVMWRFYKHGLLSCSCAYLGHGVWASHAQPLLGRKGGPAWRSSMEESSGPSFITCPLSLWTCPVTCLDLWCFCSKMRTLDQSVSRRFFCCSEMSSMTLISKRSAWSLRHLGTT